MNRRTLLKAAAAAAVVPAMSRAQNTPNGFQAVAFDGRTFVSNPGDSQDLPATSDSFFLAYSFQATSEAAKGISTIAIGGYPPAGTLGNWVSVEHAQVYSGDMVVQITFADAKDVSWAKSWKIHYDGNWHQVVIGGKFGAAPSATAILDGIAPSVQNVSKVTGYSNPTIVCAGRKILVGGQSPLLKVNFVGKLADVWGCFGAVAPTDPKVIAGFWDTHRQEAVRISADGQSAISGVRPNFFLSGDLGKFLQNGSSSIGHYSWTSSDPRSPFIMGAGELKLADSDPWNYAVVGTSAAAATARVIGARRRLGIPLR